MFKKVGKLNLLFVLFLTSLASLAQNADKLAEADSLFLEKKYTQSFDIYSDLLNKGLSSPSMLMKMAYISEGLESHSQSLYYINLYYLSTGEEAALEKMEKLSEAHNLKGYESSDTDYFMSIYYRYFTEVIMFLAGIGIILLALMVYQKRKFENQPYLTGIAFLFVMGAIFYHVNFGHDYSWAIVIDDHIPLRDGPSPAAELIGFMDEGHKVEILNQSDVWTEISWNDKPVFIKKNHLIPIKLFF